MGTCLGCVRRDRELERAREHVRALERQIAFVVLQANKLRQERDSARAQLELIRRNR